jgi:hypothetical protein
MMKRAWMIPAVIVGGGFVAWQMSGCLNSKEPDQKLASRFDDLCEIADANVDDPQRGLRKLGHYLGDHAGDMYGELGDTIALIEKIDSDEAHDARARLARRRLAKPWQECEGTWMDFASAVVNDPVAMEMFERFNERLSRTMDIIFGDDGMIDIRNLPVELMHRFEAARSLQ